MTNKEKIFEIVKELCTGGKALNEKGVTAVEVAEILNLKRNVVSHYLNELHNEGEVEKVNTRPVYFRYNPLDGAGIKPEEGAEEKQEDPFSSLIGAKGSLKSQVEQFKVSAAYPNNGLPVILTGESGVGKSYMAQLIYDYALINGFVGKNAPFVIFNCAEYANNPELLSSKLFGYKKGAFTGANSDMPGLIEEANNGYLFLDEVHRLSPEGQEKLFLILDKGTYQRLGESGNTRRVSVRFIFATTESPEKILLETFLRRIPLTVKVPSFSERPIGEKLSFIYKFFRDEAVKINSDIEVSNQVLNVLLSTKLNGNIGKLMNIIKYCSAHAYNDSLSNKTKKVKIHLSNLPQGILVQSYDNIAKKYNFNNMVISLKEKDFSNEGIFNNSDKINNMILELSKATEEYDRRSLEFDEFIDLINIGVNKIIDELVFNKEEYESQIPVSVILKLTEEGLKILENSYGVKYYGNTSNILSQSLNYFWQNIYDMPKKERKLLSKAEDIIKRVYPRYYTITNKLINLVEVNLDYKFDVRAVLFVAFYLINMNSKTDSMINSIIIAHGYSTASSIASVANKLCGDFIFEAFDMPIEVPSSEITNKILHYLTTVDTTKGLIILVDMGSLEEIYKPLLDKMKGDIAIVNNITTQIALDVGMKIKQGQTIGDIVDNAGEWNKINCKYIKYDRKKKYAILSTCITGMGTALKIKDILRECINDENIEVIAYDFKRLKENGTDDKIFNQYDVALIVGTSKLGIENIPYLCIEDIVSGNGEKILTNALKNKLSKITIEEVNTEIVKKFSIQNILNQLMILNPSRIIDQVERVISDIEIGLRKKFNNNLKISLYIHISCMIERLVVKDYIDELSDKESFVEEHSDFISLTKRAFEEISKVYKVEIPIGEIQIIYQIINNF